MPVSCLFVDEVSGFTGVVRSWLIPNVAKL